MVNKEYYIQVIKKLPEYFKRKWPEITKNFIHHQYSTRLHTETSIQKFLIKFKIDILSRLWNSPGLAPMISGCFWCSRSIWEINVSKQTRRSSGPAKKSSGVSSVEFRSLSKKNGFSNRADVWCIKANSLRKVKQLMSLEICHKVR